MKSSGFGHQRPPMSTYAPGDVRKAKSSCSFWGSEITQHLLTTGASVSALLDARPHLPSCPQKSVPLPASAAFLDLFSLFSDLRCPGFYQTCLFLWSPARPEFPTSPSHISDLLTSQPHTSPEHTQTVS